MNGHGLGTGIQITCNGLIRNVPQSLVLDWRSCLGKLRRGVWLEEVCQYGWTQARVRVLYHSKK